MSNNEKGRTQNKKEEKFRLEAIKKFRQMSTRFPKLGSQKSSKLRRLISKEKIKNFKYPATINSKFNARRLLHRSQEEFSEQISYIENEEGDSVEGEESENSSAEGEESENSSAEGEESENSSAEGEESENSLLEEGTSSIQIDEGREESSTQVLEENKYQEGEDSEESSEEKDLERSELDRPSEAMSIHRDDTDNSKASPGFVVPLTYVNTKNAINNLVEDEKASIREENKAFNPNLNDEVEEEKGGPPVPTSSAWGSNFIENQACTSEQFITPIKPENFQEKKDESEIETEMNVIDSY